MTAVQVMARVERGLAASLRALDKDSAASLVLRAVFEEFARKFKKTRTLIEAGGPDAREAIVELEQAADSARYAAEADAGAGEVTRITIIDTHDWICVFKRTGEMLRPEE